MGKLYYIVTADELELPIAVGRTVKELALIYQLECIADDYVDWSDFAGNIKMVEK